LIRLKQEQKQEINGESCLRICLLTAKGTDGSFGGNSANTRGFVFIERAQTTPEDGPCQYFG